MQERAKVNAMRSGVVVIGALAFGYLTLQLGFKPFLEKAAEAQQQQQQQQKELALQQSEQENQKSSHDRSL